MWIKLISPRMSMRPMDTLWKIRMSPPLSLLVLGALTPAEHRVTLIDENVETLRTDDTPDLVGITVKVDTMPRAAEIADLYRQRGIPVVLGGIHATACPEDCLKHADAVAIGEAEETWPVILRDAAARRLQPIYRNQGPVDIARVPLPRWDLLNPNAYLFTNTVRIGRGCPWRCDFCYSSADNFDARYRMKPIGNILREIESLGTRHVMFIDDNFLSNPALVRRLLPELKRLGLTWHTAVSADIGHHEDILDEMAEAGCRSLFIGFESLRQGNLQQARKGQNRIEEYDSTIARIHARGMMVNASLAFGFDGDDPGVFPDTLDWLVRNRVATMTAHILTPYPGTRFHRQLQAEGRIMDTDLRHYDTAHAVFRPLRMTPAELESGYRWMYDQFYSWANIWRRWPVCSGQAIAYLEFSLLYRKFGHATAKLGQWFGMRNMARLAKALAYPSLRRPRPAPRAPLRIPAPNSSPLILSHQGTAP
jgi:radical SAM superfamily enzyme YgiQ (UPF0313 family)